MPWIANCCGSAVPGQKAEHCPVCHQTFATTIAGDTHRVGEHGTPSRRCLTPEEMRTKEKKPLAQKADGLWTLARNLETRHPE